MGISEIADDLLKENDSIISELAKACGIDRPSMSRWLKNLESQEKKSISVRVLSLAVKNGHSDKVLRYLESFEL